MQIGIGLPQAGPWATPDVQVRVAKLAEEQGYASLWTFQRLMSSLEETRAVYRSVLDPLVSLAYVAGATERIRLGVAVLNAPFASPALVAKQAASLDVLSGGRLDLGIGLGWQREEFTASGTPYERRGARASEFVAALRALWSDEIVAFSGDFYTVPRARMAPLPVQRPHPPILLGGVAEPALRRAGRLGDGWISSSRVDLASIGTSIATVRRAAADAGRDPATLRFICRGVTKLRDTRDETHTPLTGTLDDIRADLATLASAGVTETFLDLNYDPTFATASPAHSLATAEHILTALAPARRS